jgi:hypothetical protein
MKHPIQPLAKDEHGTLRFQQNKIVRDLLDFATPRGFGLNEMAARGYSDDDRQQFAQLINYSLSGYGSLSYVDDEAYYAASYMAQGADERNAQIFALENKLAELRVAISKVREPIALLLEMHPDDLKA